MGGGGFVGSIQSGAGNLGKKIGGSVGGDVGAHLGEGVGRGMSGDVIGGTKSLITAGGHALFGDPGEAPDVPGQDPSYKALVDRQQKYAEDLRSGLPQKQEAAAKQIGEQGRVQGTKDIEGVKNAMSGRGLLYSGINLGKQGEATAKNIASTTAEQAQAKEQLEQKTRDAENVALQSQLSYQQNMQNLSNIATQRQQRPGGLIGGLANLL